MPAKPSKPEKARVNFVGGKAMETGTAKPKAGLLTKRDKAKTAKIMKKEIK
jgi:hypothetical protein